MFYIFRRATMTTRMMMTTRDREERQKRGQRWMSVWFWVVWIFNAYTESEYVYLIVCLGFLFTMFGYVYHMNLTVFWLRKTSFRIKEIDIWRCRTPYLPPNSAPEPWNFDRSGKLTNTVPPINDGWFKTGIIRAFFSYMGLWGFYVVLRPTCYGILEHPV